MVNKEEFFREVTVRTCRSKDITAALDNLFEYLRGCFPLGSLTLGVQDFERSAFRPVGTVVASGAPLFSLDDAFEFPPEHWQEAATYTSRGAHIVSPMDYHSEWLQELSHLMTHGAKSRLFLYLWVESESEFLGCLGMGAREGEVFTQVHADLMNFVAEPLAIVLSNHLALEKAMKYQRMLLDDNRFLQDELNALASPEIIGMSSGLKPVMIMTRQVAKMNSTVMIMGETGTGKEMVANAIHNASPRKDKPFIKVNCGAIPDTLIDSELFGHEKGSFTGATSQKRGRFERADGGTLFLDEVGELPLQAQKRLLRVLQAREVERVGGGETIKVDVRIIAATNRNLHGMVHDGAFREDLWYRLNVFPITIPPLRQRKEDIPALVHYFIQQKAKKLGIKVPPSVAAGAYDTLAQYGFPGNVRELENIVERELILSQGEKLTFSCLATLAHDEPPPGQQWKGAADIPQTLDEVMSRHITNTLKRTKGKVFGPGGAAELLGVKPSTLRARMDKLGIEYRFNKA